MRAIMVSTSSPDISSADAVWNCLPLAVLHLSTSSSPSLGTTMRCNRGKPHTENFYNHESPHLSMDVQKISSDFDID
jgi:hypothetical protein